LVGPADGETKVKPARLNGNRKKAMLAGQSGSESARGGRHIT
jgi:hypothetical protein